MALLATAEALSVLKNSAEAADPDGRVHARFTAVSALFATDLEFIEAELRRLSSEGETPATWAADHLLSAGGKRIRPLTVLLSAACFGAVPKAARDLAIVAELIHTATLLHDDVIDDSTERRGRKTARILWGNAVSVLAGDLLLTHALDRTLAAAPAALPDLLTTLRRLVDGEVIQLRGRTELDTSEASYFRVLEDKTASLFGWAARAGAVVAGAAPKERDALGTFGERLGLAFQLVDDVLDYVGDPKATGKALLSDLVEGKLTLPLVLALGHRPALLSDVALARGGDGPAAERLGTAVRLSGVCDEVRRRAAEQTALGIAALEELAPSPAREMLAVVANELTTRSR
jgi:octaprenyl-diphosphate synthase